MGRALFEKVWDAHVVADLGDGLCLLHVDRHLQHDLGGGQAHRDLRERGLGVRNPDLTFATADHVLGTEPRHRGTRHWAIVLVDSLRTETARAKVRLFDVDSDDQGIVHVIAPELGLTLPGSLVVCGDSHTCTNGALGAIGFGIGASEAVHVLATQTIVQQKPKTLRATFDGDLAPGVFAKDLILALIARIGTAAGSGYAAEYAGPAERALDMEARMTLCNLSVELGAKIGMVAPDETTYAWLRGRPFAPQGELLQSALAHWRALPSDADARFDR